MFCLSRFQWCLKTVFHKSYLVHSWILWYSQNIKEHTPVFIFHNEFKVYVLDWPIVKSKKLCYNNLRLEFHEGASWITGCTIFFIWFHCCLLSFIPKFNENRIWIVKKTGVEVEKSCLRFCRSNITWKKKELFPKMFVTMEKIVSQFF